MTAQRRGRNGYGGRRKQKQVLPQQSTSDEESTDAGSVTRCVCGESHNLGLMVQCDQCEVWQHCDCVGLEEQDIPEQYYCEECKPENHAVVKMTHGRMRRLYSSVGRPNAVVPAEKKAPKKRMTFNSREASMSLEDVLAARNALEFACPPLNESSAPNSPANSETADVKPESPEAEQKKSPVAQESDDMDVDSKDQDMETAESEADIARPAKPKRSSSARKDSDGVMNGRVAKTEKRRGGARRMNSTGSRRNQPARPRSRTSTPQPAEIGTPVADASTTIFEKLSPAARESSPPAKIRYPSARMSISEMNRRAKQILEYISSIQVDMATKDAAITVDTCALITTLATGKPKPAAITIPEKTNDDDSPSSSLSSASTIPLDDVRPNDEEKGVAEEAIEKLKNAGEQSSLEIMDVLTRELIRFQRRFGAMHDTGRHGRGRHKDINDDTGSEGEGRVTRSREASAGSTGIVPERRAAHT
ncbi:hypothetical protein BJV82DRAFT_597763 [Fennellomyces sp. T-0311]|nr:hypothetical protein BJV82DRAFT_597763 [Fennellomyces sp. T-0311]